MIAGIATDDYTTIEMLQPPRIPLSKKLEQLRAESGLSYQNLSERSCVDVAYLHRLETGRASRPSRDVLIRIGIGLGLDVEDLNELIKVAGHWPLVRGQNGKQPVALEELR